MMTLRSETLFYTNTSYPTGFDKTKEFSNQTKDSTQTVIEKKMEFDIKYCALEESVDNNNDDDDDNLLIAENATPVATGNLKAKA